MEGLDKKRQDFPHICRNNEKEESKIKMLSEIKIQKE